MTLSALASTFGGIRETDLLGCLQIDHEFKLGRLLDGQLGRFRTLKYPVNVEAARRKLQYHRLNKISDPGLYKITGFAH